MNDILPTLVPEQAAAPTEPVVSPASVTPEAQPAEPQNPAPAAYQYSPEEIQQLEQFAVTAARRLQEIQPYEDDIKRLATDNEYREFHRNTTKYYDQNRQEHQAQQQPQGQMPAEFNEVLSYVRQQQSREQAQVQQQQDAFVAEQRRIGERMRREHGLNDQQLYFLADTADQISRRNGRSVGLEEAYNTVTSFAPRAGNTPPTVGLRGDASMPGVPGPSSDKAAWLSDFRGTLAQHLKSAGNA